MSKSEDSHRSNSSIGILSELVIPPLNFHTQIYFLAMFRSASSRATASMMMRRSISSTPVVRAMPADGKVIMNRYSRTVTQPKSQGASQVRPSACNTRQEEELMIVLELGGIGYVVRY